MDANGSPDPPPASRLSFVRCLGAGLVTCIFLAACAAQIMFSKPINNTNVQIPPNLPLLAIGVVGGSAMGCAFWLLREFLQK
jgi:Mn2+/Fe2+ NRAMP family transporter